MVRKPRLRRPAALARHCAAFPCLGEVGSVCRNTPSFLPRKSEFKLNTVQVSRRALGTRMPACSRHFYSSCIPNRSRRPTSLKSRWRCTCATWRSPQEKLNVVGSYGRLVYFGHSYLLEGVGNCACRSNCYCWRFGRLQTVCKRGNPATASARCLAARVHGFGHPTCS